MSQFWPLLNCVSFSQAAWTVVIIGSSPKSNHHSAKLAWQNPWSTLKDRSRKKLPIYDQYFSWKRSFLPGLWTPGSHLSFLEPFCRNPTKTGWLGFSEVLSTRFLRPAMSINSVLVSFANILFQRVKLGYNKLSGTLKNCSL